MNATHLTRRAVCGAGLAALAVPARGAGPAAEPAHDVSFAEDFDELWRTLAERYCFFGDKQTDWARVRTLYRPLALAADDTAGFAEVVRRVLAELYDAHTHPSDPPDGVPRWPLYDLMAERADAGALRITAVQDDSAAARAGLVIGDLIVGVDGVPAAQRVKDLMPRCLRRPDPAAEVYAVNSAVAGRRGQARTLMIASHGQSPRKVLLPLKTSAPQPDLTSRRLDGRFGYIAIRSFGDTAIVPAFDKALADLRDAPGMILDVRGNGGGDTAVARPIMGRFITEPRAYATMRRRRGAGLSAPWTERVEPRGPFPYRGPVVVLADHWSGSMAEGFPMGMRDIGRGRIVGTPMMGLGAAVFSLRLDRTGVEAQYSGEPVYDTQGCPRWRLQPDVPVLDGGDILAAGIAELQRLTRA